MRLNWLTRELYATAPSLAKMKGHPEYQGWAEALKRLADRPEMEPFRDVLRTLADDALANLEPLNKNRDALAAIPFESNLKAIEAAATEPCAPAAFLAAFVCVRSWIGAAGTDLYNPDPTGRPSRAWTVFPQALVSAAMRVGAWLAALEIAEEAYNVLFASKYSNWGPIQEAMDCSRRLAHECSVAFERLVRDLAEDMREGCGTDVPNLQAEFGALLWTLGLIPQGLAYHSSQAPAGLPSRRLARAIVRRSMHRMRHDRLLQYVWLELKNNVSIQIRSHEELFAIINNQFPDDPFYTHLEVVIGDQPGRLYARALIGWFRGTLGAEEKDRYIQLVGEIGSMRWSFEDLLFTLPRMYYLGIFLGRRCGWPAGFSANESENFRLMHRWVEWAAQHRRRLTLFPDVPDPQTSLNLSLNETLELELTKPGEGADSPVERAWDVLECFRGSALEYWMTVTPPSYPDQELRIIGKRFEREEDRISWTGGVAEMLFEEEQRIDWLRGAYFLILSESLPKHFQRWATADHNAFLAHREKGGPVLDPETGRSEYEEIKRQLRTLWERMAEAVPEYAQQRTQSHASWTDVVRAAKAHRRGTVESPNVDPFV